jgi:hypothetical protein
MIPFFALLAPDHELPSIWLPTNTIKLISIPPLIFDAPLLLGGKNSKIESLVERPRSGN